MARTPNLFDTNWTTSAPGDMKSSGGLPHIGDVFGGLKKPVIKATSPGSLLREPVRLGTAAKSDPAPAPISDTPQTSEDAW